MAGVKYNDRGEEIPDPTPVEIPVGFERPPTLQEIMAACMVLSDEAEASGEESLEEANDFDVFDDDQVDFPTEYELVDMKEELPDGATEKEPVGEDEVPVGRSEGGKKAGVPAKTKRSVPGSGKAQTGGTDGAAGEVETE